MPETLVLQQGEDRTWVKVEGIWSGSDLTLTLVGGTAPHIGAVAVAQPRPSLKGDGSRSATVSVLTLPGHLEDDLARWAAKYLAVRIGAAVVVSAGIHVDGATPVEIERLVISARELVMAWAERFAPTR